MALVATTRGLLVVPVPHDPPARADHAPRGTLLGWPEVAGRIHAVPAPASLGRVADLVLELDGLRVSLTAGGRTPDGDAGTFAEAVMRLARGDR